MLLEFVLGQVVVLQDQRTPVHDPKSLGKDDIGIDMGHLRSFRMTIITVLFLPGVLSHYMGVIRSTPHEEVTISCEKLTDLNYVSASTCGWQHLMQDYAGHTRINEQVSLFYLADGHGGPDLAELTTQLIPEIITHSEHIKTGQYKTALEQLCETLDTELKKQAKKCSQIRQRYNLPPLVSPYPTSGCSLVLALVSQQEITIANIGDCKSYVCYCSNLSKAVLISGNHTAYNPDDENRVKNAGGYFVNGRVNGKLPFTRSIGDYYFKDNATLTKNQQIITAVPSIFSLRKQDIKMVVLGSSGAWQQPTFVMKELTEDDLQLSDLQIKTKSIVQRLISKNPKGSDMGLLNMSLLVIDLKH